MTYKGDMEHADRPADSPVGAPPAPQAPEIDLLHDINLRKVADEILRQVVCDCGNYRHHGVHWMPEGSGEGLSVAVNILRILACQAATRAAHVPSAPAGTRPTKIYEAMREMGKGINCIRLEVPESVAEDLAGRFNQFCNAIDAHFGAEAKAAGTQEEKS